MGANNFVRMESSDVFSPLEAFYFRATLGGRKYCGIFKISMFLDVSQPPVHPFVRAYSAPNFLKVGTKISYSSAFIVMCGTLAASGAASLTDVARFRFFQRRCLLNLAFGCCSWLPEENTNSEPFFQRTVKASV